MGVLWFFLGVLEHLLALLAPPCQRAFWVEGTVLSVLSERSEIFRRHSPL